MRLTYIASMLYRHSAGTVICQGQNYEARLRVRDNKLFLVGLTTTQ